MSSGKRSRFTRDFPTDMVEEILARLSTKDVLLCKILSKTYYELIQNPRFINKYFLLHGCSYTEKIITSVKNPASKSINNMVSMLPCTSNVYVPAPAKLPNIKHLILACSSNGLLCAQLKVRLSYARSRKNSFLLWNPVTKEHIILPHPRFDCCSAIGFWYDARSRDYKLVKIWATGTDRGGVVEFWSMKTNSWSQIQTGSGLRHTIFYTTDHRAGVLVRKKLYWLASPWSHKSCIGPIGTTLMSFDTVNNSFSTKLTLPNVVAQCRHGNKACTIIDLKGSLAVSIRSGGPTYRDEPPTSKFDIWVMDDDDNRVWTKQLSIGGTFKVMVNPTSIYVNGRFLMSQMDRYRKKESRYFLYDPRTKEEEDLPHKPKVSKHLWYQPLRYHESLASLN